jgi:hypothetical protein
VAGRQCFISMDGSEAVSEKMENIVFFLPRRANCPENFPIYRILESSRVEQVVCEFWREAVAER